MKKSIRKKVVPVSKGGIVDEDAPFWKGDTADRIIAKRVKDNAEKAKHKRTRSRRSKNRPAENRQDEGLRTLRRLERVLPKRKTLAARQRIQQRIDALTKELDL